MPGLNSILKLFGAALATARKMLLFWTAQRLSRQTKTSLYTFDLTFSNGPFWVNLPPSNPSKLQNGQCCPFSPQIFFRIPLPKNLLRSVSLLVPRIKGATAGNHNSYAGRGAVSCGYDFHVHTRPNRRVQSSPSPSTKATVVDEGWPTETVTPHRITKKISEWKRQWRS